MDLTILSTLAYANIVEQRHLRRRHRDELLNSKTIKDKVHEGEL
jgi:hypothetical protein